MANWSGRRKDAMGTLSDEFDRFQGEFEALRRRLAHLAGDTVKEFNDSPHKLAELKSTMQDRLSLLEGDLATLNRELRLRGGAVAGRLEQTVHERPFATLAIAAGVGFIAAHLLRRRRAS